MRALWGTAEAIASAAALAVLPVSVLTARSDTMDSLATALALLAAVLVVRSARTGGRWPLAAAGAAIGLAFNVKLFQALIPVPALAVLYVVASPLPIGERLSRLVMAAAVGAAVGLSWLAVVSTAPPREQPWAFGSTNGSALNATFAYNGIDRLGGRPVGRHRTTPVTAARRVPAAGPLRLDRRGRRAGQPARPGAGPRRADRRARPARRRARPAAARPRGGPARPRGRGRAWPSGCSPGSCCSRPSRACRSATSRASRPAIAVALGVGTVWLVRRLRLPVWVAGLAVAALLVAPALSSLAIVRAGTSDSGHLGASMPAREVAQLSRFLRRHSPRTRDEVASSTAVKAAPLIVRDGRPVLMLAAQSGQPVTSLHRLEVALHHHWVRYLLTAPCSARDAPRCGVVNHWAQAHGRDVTRQAGLPGRGTLFRLPAYRPQSRPRHHRA